MDGLLLIVTFFLAFWLGRESIRSVPGKREQLPIPPAKPPVAWTREQAIRQVLRELRRPPFTDIVSEEERIALVSRYYGMLADIDEHNAPAQLLPAPQSHPGTSTRMEERVAFAPASAEHRRQEAPARPIERAQTQIGREPAPVASAAIPTPPTRRPARHMPRFEPKLDPAVMLLYLGALLVVAAGLIYASYAWSNLDPWQKLGLLIGATAAFIATGLLLWRKPRVAQAGETFLAIGALLVPTNAIAAYTVLDGAQARPELPLLFGALATAVVHGAFSIRPGGRLYDAGAIIATGLAIGTVPAAFSLHVSWGGPALLFAIALLPDPRGRLAHLLPLWRILSPAAIVVALALMITGTNAQVPWILPVTLAAFTLALVRFDHHLTPGDGMIATASTLAAIATSASTIVELGAEPVTWAIVTIALSFAWLGIAAFGPPWFRRKFPIVAINVEATIGLWLAAGTMVGAGSTWGLTVATLAGIAGSIFVLIRYQLRPLMLNAGLFVVVLYLSMLPFVDPRQGNDIDLGMFLLPLPLVLAAIALQLDRASPRASSNGPTLSLFIWPLAALAVLPAVLATAVADGVSGTGILRRIALEATLYGVASLLAAWSLRQPVIRLVYGGFIVAAITAVTLSLPLHALDFAPVAVVALFTASIPTIPAVAHRTVQRFRLLAPLAHPSPHHELKLFGIVAAVPLGTMMFVTVQYIATGLADTAFTFDSSDATWPLYLLLFLAMAVGSAVVGSVIEDVPAGTRSLTWWLSLSVLTWGTMCAALLARLVTTQPIVWTWMALVAGFALANLTQFTFPTTTFTRRLRDHARSYGVALMYGGLVVNLALVLDQASVRDDAVSSLLYLGLGLVSIQMATAPHHRPQLIEGLVAIGIGTFLGTRAITGDTAWLAEAFIALAWLLSLRTLAFFRFPQGDWQLSSWLGATLIAQVIAIGFAGVDQFVFPDATGAIGWLSLTIFLALAATVLEQPAFALVATVSGVIATVMTAGAAGAEGVGVSLWMVAFAWFLFGLVMPARRLRHPAWQPHFLADAGLVVHIVAVGACIVGVESASSYQPAYPHLAATFGSAALMLASDGTMRDVRNRAVASIVSGLAAVMATAAALDIAILTTSMWLVVVAWLLYALALLAGRWNHRTWRPDDLTTLALGSHLLALAYIARHVAMESAWEGAYSYVAIVLGSLAVMLAGDGTRRHLPLQTLVAQLTGIGAVAAIAATFDGDRLTISLVLLLYGWLTTSTGIVLDRWRHPAWPRQNGVNAGLVANLAGLLIPSLMLGEMPARSSVDARIVLGLISMAGLLAVDAWERRDRLLAVLASITAVAALLYQIGTHDPANIHAYTVPLAIYILALGLLFRHLPEIGNPLLAIGSGVLVVPTLLEALDQETFNWLLLALAEGLVLFLSGLLLRLRVPIAAGVATVSIIVLRMLIDAVNAMPNWMSLAIAGLALLAIGTLWISFRDELKDRLMHMREDWVHLG